MTGVPVCKCFVVIQKPKWFKKMPPLKVIILLWDHKLLEYCILWSCFVLSKFSSQSILMSPSFHFPSKGMSEKWSLRQISYSMCFALQAYFSYWVGIITKQRSFFFFFFSRRRGRIGAWGGGIARTVMSQIALSLGKLIHQTVTSDSA